MHTIGIIPIKLNSQRVPFKNFQKLGGLELWERALLAQIASGVVDTVVIETDCPDRFVSTAHLHSPAVKILARPQSLRGDTVPMTRIIEHVISEYPADRYLQTHATSPFLQPQTLRAAAQTVSMGGFDSCYSVTKHQARFWGGTGAFHPVNHDPDTLGQTQDLEPLYEENSAFYMFWREAFENDGARICGESAPIEIAPIEAIDIDTVQDMALAELVAAGMAASENT